MDEDLKLTFLGDLMLKKEQLNAILQNGHTFSDAFKDVKCLLANSDYVIGNLETPIAGADLGYVNRHARFNAPQEFVEALKDLGVDFVATANNHCLDRGVTGLSRTIKALDVIGLKHTGTYDDIDDSRCPCVVNVGGLKIAMIAATYGTNSEFGTYPLENLELGRCVLSKEKRWMVDMLKMQDSPPLQVHKRTAKSLLARCIPARILQALCVFKHGIPQGKEVSYIVDCVRPESIDGIKGNECLNAVLGKIKLAREIADCVVVLPHVGGQSNPGPGKFQKYITSELINAGADAIISGHSHNPLEFEDVGGVPVIYSLGDFCTSLSDPLFVQNVFGEYSIVLHVYISRRGEIKRITYGIVKNISSSDGFTETVPVGVLLRRLRSASAKERLETEALAVARRVSGRSEYDFCHEESILVIYSK